MAIGRGNDVIDIGRGHWKSVNAGGGTDVLTAGFAAAATGVPMSDIGNGSTMLAGQMDLSVARGVTTLHLGLGATAGYDFVVQLTGAFAAADFSLTGSYALLV